MKPPAVLWFSLACALVACGSLALEGCRALVSYPDPRPEGGDAASCHDGVDDDLDGALDCADADCDGQCTEEPPRCLDGRDNDRDGAADTLDPACWRERALTVERCARIDGTDTTLRSGAAFGWVGSADRVLEEGREYFSATTGPALVAWADPLTGEVSGTHVETEIHHEGVGTATLSLVPLSALGDGLVLAPETSVVSIHFEDDAIVVTSDIPVGAFRRDATRPNLDWRVTFDLGGSPTLRFGGALGDAVFDFAVPSAWADDEPLVLVFEADVAPSPIVLRDIVVQRSAVEHCDRSVPEMDARGENALLDVSSGPRGLCVLASVDAASESPRRLRTYESLDGERFEESGTIEISGVPVGGSIAWDAASERWVGVVTGQDMPVYLTPTPEWAYALSGPDCAHLEVGPSLELPLAGLEAFGVDYSVLSDGAHRITFDYLALTANRYGLRDFTSVDGAPGSFAASTVDVGDEYNRLRQLQALSSIDTVLGHRIAWLELGGDVREFHELEAGRWTSPTSPILEASTTPGTFDRGRVLGPRVVMSDPPMAPADPWRGRLYFTGTAGAECSTCGRIGSANLEVLP